MSVHYKFKSNLNYDTVTFDGLHISVADLKKSIMQQKKIGKSSDFDLQITNAQTKEVYDNEETLVPKNTSVIVARVPVASGNKKNWDKPELPLPIDDDNSGQIHFDKLVKGADLVNANATEDDKVKAMINQSSQEYDPSKYVKSRSMTGPLPPTYTCYRCGKQGHWIKNCPTNNLDVKRSTGIPRSFMVPVDGPEHKGALLTSSGEYAVPIIDHQAYKEVKKEKPPFLFEPDVAPEPEAEIPEELLCMFCKNLLQDAVLIPCCGNSFCDECVRQALLDSDNHECPLCHETDISPDTVIPNRFLRTAVLNFKNETGYTRVKKLFQPTVPQNTHIESPQPSPDSTVETQPASVSGPSHEVKSESAEISKQTPPEENIVQADEETAESKVTEEEEEEECDDTQPGTPLADEPADDMEQQPIQIIGSGQYDDYHIAPYSHNSQDSYYDHNNRDVDRSEHHQISTIETITNFRKGKFPARLPVVPHQHYQHQGPPHHDHGDYGMHDRGDYHNRYDRRSHDKPSVLPPRGMPRASRYDRSTHDSRYHHADRRDYHERDHIRDARYAAPIVVEPSRQHQRYRSPPPLSTVQATTPIEIPSQYVSSAPPPAAPTPVPSEPSTATVPPHSTAVMVHPQTFPPQPPPPGASPVDNSSLVPPQPPPPGVGPLMPTPPAALADASAAFTAQSFKSEEKKAKTEEKSIDDRMEEFQRELEKRDRASPHDRSSRSSSHSRERDRSRSLSHSSHSRSYASSKSWSRSASRSVSHSRSRSRTPYSSHSRSRSFTRSRTRSRSKSRSYSRSRTRSRTKSRSRSRERRRADSRERRRNDSRDRHRTDSRERRRTDSRERRRTDSRERLPTPFSRGHSDSHSPSPRNYHARIRHRSPYPVRRDYNSQQYGNSYATAPYPSAAALVPLPLMRPAPYPSAHIQQVHAVQPPPVSHPGDHYAPERQRYPYNEQYSHYDMYQHQQPKPYGHPRYDREQRNPRLEGRDYQREYQRRAEEVQHRIPGWVGERDFKPRYRVPRDQQRKEIKELPKVPEPDIRVRELKEEAAVKKKEEKPAVKHKRHHHHHSKEVKKPEKQENKIPVRVLASVEKTEQSSKPNSTNLISVEVLSEKDIETKKISAVKPVEKVKDKKHKHKKHKTSDLVAKKKKEQKKDKSGEVNAEGSVKVKAKKKKAKTKNGEDGKKKDKSAKRAKRASESAKPKAVVPDTVPLDTSHLKKEEEVKVAVVIPETPREEHVETRAVTPVTFEPEGQADVNADRASSDTEAVILHAPADIEDDQAVYDEGESVVPPSPNKVEEEEEEVGEGRAEVEEEEMADEEEEAVNAVDDELHVQLPELSKWEREEYEEETVTRPQRKSAVVVPKDERASLSTDIIQRAEKVFRHKALKTAIVLPSTKEKTTHSKSEKKPTKLESASGSPLIKSVSKYKDQEEPKSASSELPNAATLQVTITSDKEKRSVHTKGSDQKESSKESAPKRVKLDRSKFSEASELKPAQTSDRTVVVENWSTSTKKHEDKRKNDDANTESDIKHAKRKAYDDQARVSGKQSVDRRDVAVQPRERSREGHRRDQSSSVERNVWSSDRSGRKYPSAKDSDRSKRNAYDYGGGGYGKRYADNRDHYRANERSGRETHHRRSRSRSYDSPESYHSVGRRYSSRKTSDANFSERRHDDTENVDLRTKITRRSSPQSKRTAEKPSNREAVKEAIVSSKSRSKHIPHDESNFEPDYDEFSDNERNQKDTERAKLKRSGEYSEESRKRAKQDHSEKNVQSSSSRDVDVKKEKHKSEKSVTSSPSSSSSSVSESSDSDAKTKTADSERKQKHKKSKHKKHKKHKHKHKKKKTHKSKQRD